MTNDLFRPQSTNLSGGPLLCDHWVASSVLHKAIRRGEEVTALRAALRYFDLRGSDIWRRLLTIAFEDIGCGDIDAVVEIACMASARIQRRSFPSEIEAIQHAVSRLSRASKDRSSDYLFSIVTMTTENSVANPTGSSMQAGSKLASDVIANAHELWGALGARTVGPGRWQFRYDDFIKSGLVGLGASEELIEATGIGARKIGHPYLVFVPLLATLLGADLKTADSDVPSTNWSMGIPTYGFDMHTRVGKAAIAKFIVECQPVRSCLETLLPVRRWSRAAELACFYADAAPTARSLDWELGRVVREEAIRVEFARFGISTNQHHELLNRVSQNLDTLNSTRAELYVRAHADTYALQNAP